MAFVKSSSQRPRPPRHARIVWRRRGLEVVDMVNRRNGKENGNYYSILGLYRGNGKENGNYYSILGLYRGNGKENGNYYGTMGSI